MYVKKILMCCLLVCNVNLAWAQDDVYELLQKHIKAVGGQDLISSVKTVRVKMLSTFYSQVNPDLKMVSLITNYYHKELGLRQECSRPNDRKSIFTSMGDTSKAVPQSYAVILPDSSGIVVSNPAWFKGMGLKTPDDLIIRRDTLYIKIYEDQGIPFNSLSLTLKMIEDGLDGYSIKEPMKLPNGIEYIHIHDEKGMSDYYLDPTTYLIMGQKKKFNAEEQIEKTGYGEMAYGTTFADYKNCNGLMIPTYIQKESFTFMKGIGLNQNTTIQNLYQVEINQPIKNTLFGVQK